MGPTCRRTPVFQGEGQGLHRPHRRREIGLKKWTAYNKLAWTETTIAPPEEYEEEAEFLAKLISGRARIPVKTLLHLGCGAGGHDHTLKRHFEITGVDISEGMLEIARGRNPEAVYILGDMRDVRLKELFDAVAIPDSIGYMATPADLRKAVDTAFRHLKPGGALLITALVAEDFRENNFAYSGSRESVDITIFENNRRLMKRPDQYEATLVYLIRPGDRDRTLHSGRISTGSLDGALRGIRARG
ncbi:MAG: class I SAM-dependent methyltransferase [Acidobacteriota bacterium]|nr:class I SAM-dependent methyltransferase [Acidobacteriota bacterium]